MQTNTLNLLINMFNVASNDETRQHINSVLIETFNNGFKFTATDGHVLATTKLMIDDLFSYAPDLKFSVPLSSLKMLKLLVKQGPIQSSIVKNQLMIGNITIQPSNMEFPRYQAIIPTKLKNEVSLCFNIDSLARLNKALGRRRVSNLKIRFSPNTLNPVIVEVFSTGKFDNFENPMESMVFSPMKEVTHEK